MKRLSKENFKTILVGALFLLSIALNQQLWNRLSLAKIIPSITQTKTIEMKNNIVIDDVMSKILTPQSLDIHFGGGSYTVLYDDDYEIFSHLLEIFKDENFIENTSVESMSEKQWNERLKFRYIQLNFSYKLPIESLQEMTNSKKEGFYKKIDTIKSILISPNSNQQIEISIKDGQGNLFDIRGKAKDVVFSQIIDNVEQSQHQTYYTLKDVYNVENHTLIPIEINSEIQPLEVEQEINADNKGQVEAFAGTFFGENLDFIRRIKETDGSVTYMYGYGQKQLRIEHTGVLQYIEELDDEKISEEKDIYESIKLALQFISAHGEFTNIDAYLKSIQPIEENNKNGYLISFAYRLNGLSIYCKGHSEKMDAPIQVKVLGNQVVEYKRSLKREKTAMKILDNSDQKEILSVSEVLDKNFPKMKDDFLINTTNNNPKKNNDLIQKDILESIKKISIGYYDHVQGKNNELSLVWVVRTGKMTYYFNAQNGTIIKRFKM